MLRNEIDFIELELELELELIASLLKIITHTLIKYADLHKMLHKKFPNLSEWGFWICFSGGTYASNDAKFSLALIISMFGYFCGLFDCTITGNRKLDIILLKRTDISSSLFTLSKSKLKSLAK